MVTTNGVGNGVAHGFRLEDEVRAPLRADAFVDEDGEMVLGILLAYGRAALDEATREHGLERRDFYRIAHMAVYDGINAQPEHHTAYLPENVLDWVAAEARLSEGERPLRHDLETWRDRGDAYGAESLGPYVERLKRARRERELARRLDRARQALDLGDLDRAEALVADAATSLPTTAHSVGSEVAVPEAERECSGAALLAEADQAPAPSLPFLGQDGYFVKGRSHLVAGYSRVGKTEVLTRAAREWIDAGETVYWLSEEPRDIWKERLGGLDPPACGDWSGLTVRFALGDDPVALRRLAVARPHTVIIWDTLRNLLQPVDEKDNSELARLINPVVAEMRAAGKTLVMGHHDTKAEAEHGKAIAGGHSLMACFDAPMEIKFADGGNQARRVVTSYARLRRPPDLLYERREDGTMHALGSPEGASLAAVADRCVGLVVEEEGWLKTGEVLAQLDDPKPGYETARKALGLAAEQGRLWRDPPWALGEVRGKTVRWGPPGAPKTSLPTGRLLVGSEVATAGGDR